MAFAPGPFEILIEAHIGAVFSSVSTSPTLSRRSWPVAVVTPTF